jgi:hypothetical protein
MKHRFVLLAILWLCHSSMVWAHQVTLSNERGQTLLVLTLLPEWTVLASQEGLELTSPNSRTRLHCLELRSCKDVEEGKVFLKTLRDTIYQSYQEVSTEAIEVAGKPVLRLRATGISRGFETAQDALIFRTRDGTFCLVMLQQDVGYEGKALLDLLAIP